MQPVDRKAASAFSVVRSVQAIPAICLVIFTIALLITSGTTKAAFWTVLISALVSSIAGFAFSPIAGAFLFHTLSEPLMIVQILLVASIAQQIYCVWRLRESIEMRRCAPYLFGSILTLPIGLHLLFNSSVSTLLPMLGVLLITYGAFTALKPKLQSGTNPLWGRITVGALGGVTGGLAAFPAAFVSIWCHIQGFDKHRARSIVQPFILVNQLVSLSLLTALKPSQSMSLGLLAYAAPAVLGAYGGLIIFDRLDTSTFNRIVGVLLMFAGIGFVSPL
ncbi:sulfite exporter TauE/SafE family protein [Bradyrhizobium glycinis]|uniref:sulfite exporter TauE/SafE family protein n=1 Tax=Bradyrhizobium glycinis TaxID=2751812 RepID=UPI0018D963F5|nr:sulfite exporter TauE/SafE family protein [Bradyrhizobium glycinis]MBH5369545.1 sulfite exporter TauE/SafE family protein [Bradyrhizobium glycinis]